jgi:transposase-like protein
MVPATPALMIVGLLTVRRKEAPAMAGAERMTVDEVVKKVLLDEHADVISILRPALAELGADQPGHLDLHHLRRDRLDDTRAGEIELQTPRIRQRSYFPSFLEPRKRSEQALLAVIQQAYVCGVSTRRVDRLVDLFLDAKMEKVRAGGLVNKALVIAHGVHETRSTPSMSARSRPRRSGPPFSAAWSSAAWSASSLLSATLTPA